MAAPSIMRHAVSMMLTLCLACALSSCGGGSSGPRSVASSSSSSVDPAVSGLDARPANASCVAGARYTNDLLSLQRVFPAIALSQPVGLWQAPGNEAWWYAIERAGHVVRFGNQNTVTATSAVLDLTDRVDASGQEMGLLGLAFHPDFPSDPRAFVSYTTSLGGTRRSRVSAFTTTDGGATLDRNTEQVLVTVDQPESNHNGGHIAFGPDRLLYIGFGDGGGGNDQHGTQGNGQELTTLLGKLLRIDVGAANATGYTVPTGNPYAGNSHCGATGGASACPEIFAYGFRNPWRWSFDRQNGDLWLGDVGQNAWEEIDRVTVGNNYGWRCREGAHLTPNVSQTNCTGTYVDPVIEYAQDGSTSVTGGYVYRGSQSAAHAGKYFFADYVKGAIWAYTPGQAGTTQVSTQSALVDSDLLISSFAQDSAGELYVLDLSGGGIYKLVFQSSMQAGEAVPDDLAATGCAAAGDPRQAVVGQISYEINAPFWSDGASKTRWLALPGSNTISVMNNGDWDLPPGAVLRKDFALNGQLIETRLLMHHSDGEWAGYTYEWNDAQTAATRVPGGKQRSVNGQTWIYPAESTCMDCHTAAAGHSLGLTTVQLNRQHMYASTGRTRNQLDTLSAVGVLTPTVNSISAAKLTDPGDTSATLDARARAYLDTNCAQCHQPGGPTSSAMDLRAGTSLSNTQTCDVVPTAGDLGLTNARLIAPGEAARSVLIERVNLRDANGMPPLASTLVDAAGVQLLTQWVNGLSCY